MTGRPLRISFVVPDLMVGGAERHVVTLLPRMDPQRFQPSVVCLGEEGGLFADLTATGIPARALHRGDKRQAGRALVELTSIMRRERPDVVVVRGYSAETLGRLAARAAGVPHTVMWVHNIGDPTPRGNVRRFVDARLSGWTSAYFGVAEAQRRYLTDDLGYRADKIRIIHNGVDPALFDARGDRDVLGEFGWCAGDPTVAIVAELSPIKDHATLLRAARLVVDRLPRARFLVVGDGACRTDLEAITRDLGLVPNVHFTGIRRDVARLLGAVDVFTLSSTTVECFSIALLEAMACGRPAVCTAVGGIPEMIDEGRTGHLVPPSDPRLLAARLLDVLGDPVTARRMGAAARRRVEDEFSLDRSVTLAEQAFEDVAGVRYATAGRS